VSALLRLGLRPWRAIALKQIICAIGNATAPSPTAPSAASPVAYVRGGRRRRRCDRGVSGGRARGRLRSRCYAAGRGRASDLGAHGDRTCSCSSATPLTDTPPPDGYSPPPVPLLTPRAFPGRPKAPECPPGSAQARQTQSDQASRKGHEQIEITVLRLLPPHVRPADAEAVHVVALAEPRKLRPELGPNVVERAHGCESGRTHGQETAGLVRITRHPGGRFTVSLSPTPKHPHANTPTRYKSHSPSPPTAKQ